MRIPSRDLRVDVFRNSAHVRVDLLHLPTGIRVSSEDKPTEGENRRQALLELQAQLERL
jgi:protein subunit release factor A